MNMTGTLQRYAAVAIGFGFGCLALPAHAQEGDAKPSDRPNQDRPERPRPPGGGGLFRVLDRNADGELDQEEIDMAVASLRKLDRNGDGKITPNEMGPPPRDGAPRDGVPRDGAPRDGVPRDGAPRGGNAPSTRIQLDFATFDKDGDGKVSKEEAPEAMQQRFERMDRNGDGFIDKGEQEAVMRFIRQRVQDGGAPGVRDRDRGAGEGGSEKPKRPAADES